MAVPTVMNDATMRTVGSHRLRNGPARIRTPLQSGCFSAPRYHRGLHQTRSSEHVGVVELAPVAENVRVDVSGDAELALPDKAGDLGPRAPLVVEQRDPAVPEIVR